MKKVQCKGSGKSAGGGINVRRARCPDCGREQDVASNGNIKRHDRLMRGKQLRRGY